MRRKAKILEEKLNAIEGVSCMPIEGAMYAFPEIALPERYMEHCRGVLKKEPDTAYSLEILKKLGVVVVPGNGFGQRPGTYHFRITILPPEEDLVRILDELKTFHEGILKEWA